MHFLEEKGSCDIQNENSYISSSKVDDVLVENFRGEGIQYITFKQVSIEIKAILEFKM